MKFKVELTRRILPPGHVGPVPPGKYLVEHSEYIVDATGPQDVIKQFERAKAQGLPHLQGRTIRSIEKDTRHDTAKRRLVPRSA